ncbi:hypothetical protein LIER_33713 [Lithospermum erythrorhizon]|uniref:Uncharacterized protein n=1 Tax=Lithospermum erythrorhizon TaxID=34254 RepID=A0AAV3S0W2_LITER
MHEFNITGETGLTYCHSTSLFTLKGFEGSILPKYLIFTCKVGIKSLLWMAKFIGGKKVSKVLGNDDAKQVLAIPLSRHHIMDRLVWNHTRSGCYLTCSRYKSAREMKRKGVWAEDLMSIGVACGAQGSA